MPTALVTGVGRRRGIGAAIARRLHRDGWALALAHHAPYDERVLHEPSDVLQLAHELTGGGPAGGPPVHVLAADLADPGAAAGLLPRAAELLGGVDALVMSHCESVDSSILTTTVESFDRHYAVNVRGSWLLMKAFAEGARGRQAAGGWGGGSVVALTSDHTAHNLPYGATKGALDRLVLAGCQELAELRIRCNVVNPGPIDTGWMDDATRATLAAATPGGELGSTDTVARLVAFLLGDEGCWINGQRLSSNGGFAPTPV